MTPSEVMAAREAGFHQLKLFPAVPAGGVGMLNAIAGPLPDVLFADRRDFARDGGAVPGLQERGLRWRFVADAEGCVGGRGLGACDCAGQSRCRPKVISFEKPP